ncbi:ABC transporter substrate-binding protein [Petroclostridium sp. X23]|uniref:ABC transporter substrate-binding protein n=1 Tax=Petroclostridium sp. X23 TaxID=3045146 RepID=UPI0024AE6BFD|nr:ABC transporter substrate-binding protein [Petroclostridium sp. X23]WHH60944.1 ABC transporter substrate-binding protein [Petroclostridium sp. X23]
MKKWYSLLGVVVLILIFGFSKLSTAIGTNRNNTSEVTATNRPKTRTLVSSYQPYLHALPQYMGIKNGWYEKEGIDLVLKHYPSGLTQNEDLLSDIWEVGDEGGTGALLASMRYGLHIIGISNDESQTNSLWVRPNSDILSVKGYNPKYPEIYGSPELFKGKTIITTSASTGHYAVIATLRTLGLTEKDVNTIHLEQEDALKAFEEGEGDIVQLWAPYSYIAEENGWIEIASGKKAGVTIPGVLVASKKAVQEKPDLVSKWLELYFEGIQVMKEDPDGSADLLREFYEEHGMEISENGLKKEFSLRPLSTAEEQLENFNDFKQAMIELADYFVQQGRIEKADRDRFVNQSYVTDRFLKDVVQSKR